MRTDSAAGLVPGGSDPLAREPVPFGYAARFATSHHAGGDYDPVMHASARRGRVCANGASGPGLPISEAVARAAELKAETKAAWAAQAARRSSNNVHQLRRAG